MKTKNNLVESLSRGLAIMSLIAESPTLLTLTELSTKLSVSKSVIQRLTFTLEHLGYLNRNSENKKFGLGPRTLSIGFSAMRNLDLKKFASPFMQETSKKIGETVNLAVLDGAAILYVERIVAIRTLSINVQIGSWRPLYCTSMGKTILAFMPENLCEEIIKTIKLIPFTTRTIIQKRALREELKKIRARGFAISDEELEVGVRSVAAPIRDFTQEVIASVNIAAPASRVSLTALETDLAEEVVKMAKNISSAMGFQKSGLKSSDRSNDKSCTDETKKG